MKLNTFSLSSLNFKVRALILESRSSSSETYGESGRAAEAGDAETGSSLGLPGAIRTVLLLPPTTNKSCFACFIPASD